MSTPMAAATLWIDTDGWFYLLNHKSERDAENHADALAEAGIPVIVMTRQKLIRKATK